MTITENDEKNTNKHRNEQQLIVPVWLLWTFVDQTRDQISRVGYF